MLCILIRTSIVAYYGLQGSRNIFNQIMNSLIRAPINLFYDITPIGRIINRLSKDMENIDLELSWLFGSLITYAFVLIGGIVLCVIYVPLGVLAVPLCGVIGYRV